MGDVFTNDIRITVVVSTSVRERGDFLCLKIKQMDFRHTILKINFHK